MFFIVGSLEQLKILIKLKTRQIIHLKFDTGMHRQGILYHQLDEVIHILNKKTTIQINGIMSHLADADNPNSKLTELQIERWNKLAKQFQKNFSNIRYYHLANSAGFAYAKDIIANIGRTGIALYGINQENLLSKFQPVLRMNSIISEIRTIAPNESVGYNGTFVAQHKMKIATVPAGYFEGVDRRLSNKGFFLIKNKLAPLCGRVSMNISSCDITDIVNAVIGSPINIISNYSEDQNSVKNIAKLCDTISYEILAHLPSHLRRIIIK
ncbi:MAG: alanine racemase [Candidatus Kuenenbacteria bacterium]